MSDGSFRDVGPDPAGRCRHLRTKMMSVVLDYDEHAAEYPSTSAAYWCLKTMGPVGPDDGPAALDDCRAGRPCFQAQPQAALYVSGVLLAAGASSRFGSPKMLAPVGEDGKLLLQKVCETWLEAGIGDLVIVLGCEAADIRARIEENLLRRVNGEESAATAVRFVENPKWETGMFSSVKAGVSGTSARSTHIAISPADLPFLSKGTLRTVIGAAASADERTVVVPTCRRRRGHPLVIPAALRARVLSWPDSARLNQLFEEPDVTVHHLEGFDETILHDVDRPEDLLTRSGS